MENWRDFLNEQNNQSFPSLGRAAAIIWNDPDYKPVDEFKEKSKILKAILPENISQGHAGIILLQENPNFIVRAYCFSFGIDKDKIKPKDPLEIIRKKVGLFVQGKVTKRQRGTTIQVNNQNLFDMIENNDNNAVKSIIDMLKRHESAWGLDGIKQFGLVPKIDIKAAIDYAQDQSHSLYNIIPKLVIGGSEGDNCGSYALKVAAAGLQGPESGEKTKEAASISYQFIGPTDMLPILQKLGWVTVAMSFK